MQTHPQIRALCLSANTHAQIYIYISTTNNSVNVIQNGLKIIH